MTRLIHKTPLQDNVVKGERKEILISFPNQSNFTGRNRMHVAVDDNHYSYYAYDYSGGSCGSREQSQACLSYAEMEQRRRGQRRIKLTGDNSVLDVNADYMRTVSTLEKVTLYPSAYMVLTDRGYTKHYYTGMERVAARIGDGGLDVGIYLSNTDSLHARANRLYGQSLAQVNRRVLEANDVDCIMDGEMPVEELGIPFEEIPEQMSATVGTEYGEFFGAMHLVSNAGESPEVYYYHGDHLGSASWKKERFGKPFASERAEEARSGILYIFIAAVQHLQYLPFGERFVNQRTSGYSERFTFTGKERDVETGYGYFGARYMDHELMTMWLSVDPLADKYPSISPYAYCAWNPVKLVDPDGRDIWIIIDIYDHNAPRLKWTKEGLLNEDGSPYKGDNEFAKQVALALNAIYEDNEILLSQFMDDSKYDIAISETDKATMYYARTVGSETIGYSLSREQPISFNPTMGLSQCKPDADDEEYLAPFICLLHEFGHAYNAVTDYNSYSKRKNTRTNDAYGDSEEMFVIQQYEQPAAAKHGMLQRTSHKYGVEGLSIIKTAGPLSSEPIR